MPTATPKLTPGPAPRLASGSASAGIAVIASRSVARIRLLKGATTGEPRVRDRREARPNHQARYASTWHLAFK